MKCCFCDTPVREMCYRIIGQRGGINWVCTRKKNHRGPCIGCSCSDGPLGVELHVEVFTNELLTFELSTYDKKFFLL
jgi:hypothetical protein